MLRKIVGWMKDNPALTSLIVFIMIQTIINTVLFMRVFQLQEALRELMLTLFPPYPTYRF